MQRKWVFVAVLSLSLLFAAAGVAAARDPEAPPGFDNSSFTGTYAAISINGDTGVIGLCNMDGVGAFSCNFTVNVPGQNKDRMVVPASSTGTYSLTAEGIGLAPEEQKAPDGTTNKIVNLLAVTDAKAVGRHLLATEVDSASPNDQGGTDHSVLRRLPDVGNIEGGFSNASVDGVYALSSPFGPGVVGICHMDGAGNFVCDLTAAAPGDNGNMQMLSIANTGAYTVTSDGMGSVHYTNTFPDGSTQEGDDDFVISAAEADGPFTVATELTDLGRDPGDDQGALAVTILRRLPDLADTAGMTETASMSDTTSGQ